MSEKKGINEKIKELEAASEWFYSEEFELAEAPEKYKKAVKLAKEIEKDLENLKNEIEIVDKDFTKEA